jgi:hypothetical protein
LDRTLTVAGSLAGPFTPHPRRGAPGLHTSPLGDHLRLGRIAFVVRRHYLYAVLVEQVEDLRVQGAQDAVSVLLIRETEEQRVVHAHVIERQLDHTRRRLAPNP